MVLIHNGLLHATSTQSWVILNIPITARVLNDLFLLNLRVPKITSSLDLKRYLSSWKMCNNKVRV